MNFKTIALAFGFIVLAAAIGVSWWQRGLNQPGPLAAAAEVVIEPGEGSARIGNKLESAGVIASAAAFKLAVRQLGVAGRLQTGDYLFEPHTSLRGVVEKIAKGDSTLHSLTIPEGLTTRQVIGLVEASTELSGTVVRRPGEGELFPDTYTFRLHLPRQKLLDEMAKNMASELQKAWEAHQPMLPYNGMNDLLIMASIVQKEAANEAEMPQIAGVFINRLNQKMRLQSDPTVIYGMEDYKGNLQRKDLADSNPFNTYTNAGLPPTPISNPGRAALLAAANPVSTTALFFVADVSRTGHVFTNTYAQHQKAVQQLIKATTPQKPATKAKQKGK